MPNTETIIWGHKPESPDNEVLLLTHAERYDLAKVLPVIESDGWIVRIATIDLDTPPDFAATIQ